MNTNPMSSFLKVVDNHHKIMSYGIGIYTREDGAYLIIRKDHFNDLRMRLPNCNFLLNELGGYLFRRLKCH